MSCNPERATRLRELQTEIIRELERLGSPVVAIHYTLTQLLPHSGLTWAMVAQRVRQAKERRRRLNHQASQRPALKDEAISAFAQTCAYCDRVGTVEADPDGNAWNLDRIVPGARGGEYEPSNVALACHRCNQKKGANFTFRPPPSLADLRGQASPVVQP